MFGRYLIFYLVSGIFAGIFYSVLSYYFGIYPLGARIFLDPSGIAVGASGAIYALLGLLAVLTPYNKVYLIAGPLFAIIISSVLSSIFPTSPIVGIASFVVTFYIIYSVFAMFSFDQNRLKYAFPIEMPFWLLPIIAIVPLVVVGLFVELPIGNMAHLGGLIAGFIYAAYLKNKFPRKTAKISKIFR